MWQWYHLSLTSTSCPITRRLANGQSRLVLVKVWGELPRFRWFLVSLSLPDCLRRRSVTGGSAASWILYPGDEPVTMRQIDVLSKEVLVHTGTTVPMLTRSALYGDHFNSIMWRTKIVASVSDAKKIQRYVYPDKYGVHRCATFGDFRERIKDIAGLIGFSVIEEDVWWVDRDNRRLVQHYYWKELLERGLGYCTVLTEAQVYCICTLPKRSQRQPMKSTKSNTRTPVATNFLRHFHYDISARGNCLQLLTSWRCTLKTFIQNLCFLIKIKASYQSCSAQGLRCDL